MLAPFEEQEFIYICKCLNYNNRKRQIAVKFFVEKWGIMEVWEWMLQNEKNAPDYDSIKRMKYRIQKDIIEYQKIHTK
jgi:hypothetical protein